MLDELHSMRRRSCFKKPRGDTRWSPVLSQAREVLTQYPAELKFQLQEVFLVTSLAGNAKHLTSEVLDGWGGLHHQHPNHNNHSWTS